MPWQHCRDLVILTGSSLVWSWLVRSRTVIFQMMKNLTKFAQAWVNVGKMQKTASTEDEQIAAIEKEGLSLDRFNRIAELTETYQSVENQVDERIKKLQ